MCQFNCVPTLWEQSPVLSDIVLSASIIVIHPADSSKQVQLIFVGCHSMLKSQRNVPSSFCLKISWRRLGIGMTGLTERKDRISP